MSVVLDQSMPSKVGSVAPEVSVVMPCLNEAETLEFCIREAQAAFLDSGIDGEIVIADNGSTDGSQPIAMDLGARVVDVAEKGYGSALQGGIAAARGTFVVMADADGSYDFGHLPRFVQKLREGFDLVMGNRFQGGIQSGAMPWKHRYIGNPVLSGIGRLFFKCPAGDFHCGLRGFRRESYEALELNTTGMEFASEMVIRATLQGQKIAEIPTILRPDGRTRAPHLRSWRDGWRHLRFMLLYCPRWLFFLPGCMLSLAGAVLLLLIARSGVLWVGQVGLSVNTSLTAAVAVIVGYQLVLAGIFTSRLCGRLGLYPEDQSLQRLSQTVNLEMGVVAGFCLMAAAGFCFADAVWQWQQVNFGPLSPALTVSRIIPAVTLFFLGSQTVSGSFFLSVLGLVSWRQ